jgi:hypothetical protein
VDRWIELIFGFHELYINVNHLAKIQLKMIKGVTTSFLNWKFGQSLQTDGVLKI